MNKAREGRILALSKVSSGRHITIPVTVVLMLEVKPKEYIAWVLEHGDIVVRKGKWVPAK